MSHKASVVEEDKRSLATTSVEDEGHDLMMLAWIAGLDQWPRQGGVIWP